MDAEQFKRVKELFYEALERKPEERSTFLDEACRDDQALRAEVEKLLAEDARPDTFMEPLVFMDVLDTSTGEKRIGTRIGGYLLKRVISSGGMGIVYEAFQEHPRRTIALKVMKPGTLSSTAIKRFEYEAQILAGLQHPNIAQLFEVGTQEEAVAETGEEKDSLPYFVMEYIHEAKTTTSTAPSRFDAKISQIACTGLALFLFFVFLYISSYLLVRARHDLLMTGWFHNVHHNGSLAPEAGWRDLQIKAQSPGTTWMEGTYAPLIWLEARLQVGLAGEHGD